MTAAQPTFEELFRSCERSALHLEMRDGYMRSDPMFLAWRAGHRDDSADTTSPGSDRFASCLPPMATVTRPVPRNHQCRRAAGAYPRSVSPHPGGTHSSMWLRGCDIQVFQAANASSPVMAATSWGILPAVWTSCL